jgi:hypothetical protein
LTASFLRVGIPRSSGTSPSSEPLSRSPQDGLRARDARAVLWTVIREVARAARRPSCSSSPA